jgi:hypothetical protein
MIERGYFSNKMSTKETAIAWQMKNDTIAAFFDEDTGVLQYDTEVIYEEGRTHYAAMLPKETVWEAYLYFCEANNNNPETHKAFESRIRREYTDIHEHRIQGKDEYARHAKSYTTSERPPCWTSIEFTPEFDFDFLAHLAKTNMTRNDEESEHKEKILLLDAFCTD